LEKVLYKFQAWWHVPAMPVVGRWRLEYREFAYIASPCLKK
jgi:hypothetical protein